MRAVLLVLLLAARAPAADPPARVTVDLAPKDGVWVGQRVTLAVTLYTPDLFAGAPAFEVPPIPGVVVLPPAGSPVVGSERVGGDTFTTQRHEFALYPQRGGPVRVPAFPVRFETNAGFGKPVTKRVVATEPVAFEARVPPGAEGLGLVVAARDLRVTESWTPEPKAQKVGDAVTLSLTVTAPDVPGMVFPPLLPANVEGLAAYPKDPAVNDHSERGALTGVRTDAVTFVCECAGTVAIPDRTLTWFDLETKRLRRVELRGRTFDVAPAPSTAVHADDEAPPSARRVRWRLVAAVLVAGGVCVRFVSHALDRSRRFRLDRNGSEPAQFARFAGACRSAEPHATYLRLLDWLDCAGPLSLDEFASRFAGADLARQLAVLSEAAFGRETPNGHDGLDLLRGVSRAREALRRDVRSSARHRPALPPLNP